MFVILSGLVKILKHSARLFLEVMDGLKVISPLFSLALTFLSFLLLVRDRKSCLSPSRRGLYFGKICCILVSASFAQLWGSRHPCILSSMHSWQTHHAVVSCSESVAILFILADTCIRSATVVMLWRSSRHLDATFLMGRNLLAMWYHAGSWARSLGVSRIAARFMLYFLAILIILFMSLFRFFILLPLVGTFQDWRKGLSLALGIVFAGVAVSIIRSIILAQSGQFGLKSRYVLSQVISIASFCAWMSNSFSSPSSIGFLRTSIAILGEESSSHMKFLMILVSATSM